MDVLDRNDLEMQMEHNIQETRVKTTWLLSLIEKKWQNYILFFLFGILVGALFVGLPMGYASYEKGILTGLQNCTTKII